ncbi:hypothetical protein ACJROX_10910 [Pseudalkalibacillus sp. A8]|uniref:hypothetical protein n=1 Tax=Pseudalkalibacillus sp. A8 TaxID=3382641 RepID=UPI0038B4FF03
MGIKEFFTGKKKTELEKNIEERNLCGSKLQELQADLRAFNEAKKHVETELRIDQKNNTLKGRLNKLNQAIEETQREIDETNKRAGELANEISKLNKDKKTQEIHDVAKRDIEVFKRQHRASILNKKLYPINLEIESRAGSAGALSPNHLTKYAGKQRLDRGNPEDIEYLDVFDEMKNEVSKEAQKELEEVLEKVDSYLNG